jgi:hypothetical protein
MKYGGSVGMVEKNYNVPWSMVDYEKLTKYEESVGRRGCGHRKVNQANALDPRWSVWKSF